MLVFAFFVLEWELPSTEHKNIRFRVRGALSYSVGQVVAQLGICLLEGSCPIKNEPLKPRNRCVYYDSQVGASFLGTQISSSPIGDESFER